VDQPTLNPARTRLTHGLSELGWVQPTFKKVKFFSTQPGSNSCWARLAHGLKPILTSLETKNIFNPFENYEILMGLQEEKGPIHKTRFFFRLVCIFF